MEKQKQIIIYETEKNIQLDVTLEADTVWLNQKQMSELFDKNYKTISRHINNIYREGELERNPTVSYFETVQTEGGRKITRKIEYYNLDVIISVGYRVKSLRGTQFRIWANKILKDYLVQGFSINEKRLKEKTEQITNLKHIVQILSEVADYKTLSTDEAKGLIAVIADYTYALDTLDLYDYQQLEIKDIRQDNLYKIDYDEALKVIKKMKEKFKSSTFFGKEKDKSFQSSLNTIYQTYDGKELYPSIEEKAAHLLYFIVKNHSFIDGNKRIAASLFLWFLQKNNILYSPNGAKRIADNALVALTLMCAVSEPKEKNIMIKIIVNLINAKN